MGKHPPTLYVRISLFGAHQFEGPNFRKQSVGDHSTTDLTVKIALFSEIGLSNERETKMFPVPSDLCFLT